MIDLSKLNDKDKVAILNNIYNQVHSETIRYRDLELKVTAWILAIQIGVLGSTQIMPLKVYASICFVK